MFTITEKYHGKMILPQSKLEAHIEHGGGAVRSTSKRGARPKLWSGTVWLSKQSGSGKTYKVPVVVTGHSKGEMLRALRGVDEIHRQEIG